MAASERKTATRARWRIAGQGQGVTRPPPEPCISNLGPVKRLSWTFPEYLLAMELSSSPGGSCKRKNNTF